MLCECCAARAEDTPGVIGPVIKCRRVLRNAGNRDRGARVRRLGVTLVALEEMKRAG